MERLTPIQHLHAPQVKISSVTSWFFLLLPSERRREREGEARGRKGTDNKGIGKHEPRGSNSAGIFLRIRRRCEMVCAASIQIFLVFS